ELKHLPAAEGTAVCQCSGNRRGLFQPHVPGVEWGYGAMGCARWKGARLKDVLDKAGLKKEAVEIVFNGTDGPALDKTPDFIKSIPDRKSTRLNSSHVKISYAVFCLKKKKWSRHGSRDRTAPAILRGCTRARNT